MNRQQTLDAALNAVNARRAYGPPENNFLRIARRWNLHILNRYGVHLDLQPVDVAIMMADVKMARLEETPDHPDSWVDLCGYGACGSEISSGAETVYDGPLDMPLSTEAPAGGEGEAPEVAEEVGRIDGLLRKWAANMARPPVIDEPSEAPDREFREQQE